jgi:hypothetical protein
MLTPIVPIVPVKLCTEKTLRAVSNSRQKVWYSGEFLATSSWCVWRSSSATSSHLGVVVSQKLALGLPKGVSQSTAYGLSFFIVDTSPNACFLAILSEDNTYCWTRILIWSGAIR